MGCLLIVSASMGSGHDGAAAELARRMRARGHRVERADLLDLYPFGLGRLLRVGYLGMLRFAPWLYALIYQLFFVPRPSSGLRASLGLRASPAALMATPGLGRLIRAVEPDAIVSTYHLAGMTVGILVRRGRVTAPSIIVVTEASIHRLWCDAAASLYLCTYPGQAEQVQDLLGVEARSVAPLVRPEFIRPTDQVPGADLPVVLVSTGSLGIGHPQRIALALISSGRYRPVVLCGRNEKLANRLRKISGCGVLGWTPDLSMTMSTAAVLVENSGGGLTSWEAFAVGLPVISFDPLPGHGRDGVSLLDSAGLSIWCADEGELLRALDDVTAPGSPTASRLRAAASALFCADAASIIDLRLAASRAAPEVPS